MVNKFDTKRLDDALGNDSAAAVTELIRLVIKGDIDAMVMLSVFWIGQPSDDLYLKGVKLLEVAAGKGNPEAQWRLGSIYLYGDRTIEPNVDIGLQWLERASKANFAWAKVNLADHYAGLGDSESMAKANALYEEASILGLNRTALTL